jgi:hypothetical protein
MFGASSDAFMFFPPANMDVSRTTIGLSDLLDEIGRDLDDYRRKHPNDYQLKPITLWWELERERMSLRFHGQTVLLKTRHRLFDRRILFWLLAGWTTLLIAATLLRV